MLSNPVGLVFDLNGNLLIAENGNDRVRKLDLSTRVITTFAGGGGGGDNVPATQARLSFVNDITRDAAGNVYISEDNSISRISAATGLIKIVVGAPLGGGPGSSGDGGPATAAKLRLPRGLWVDAAGNLFIADFSNHRIRVVRGPVPGSP